MTTIVGYLYTPTGATITTGKLYLTLQQDIVVGGQKVAPARITFDLSTAAPAGYVDLDLYPTATASPSGVSYFVEFDPTPSDTTVPMHTKSGYWFNYWNVPDTPTANIGSFVSALRGTPSSSYLPLGSAAVAYSQAFERITGAKVLTATEIGKCVMIDTATATTVTLPTAVEGLHYTVSINVVTSSGSHAIAPGGGVTIKGNGLTKSAGDSLTITADAVGDFVRLVALDASTWWIVMSRGSWA